MPENQPVACEQKEMNMPPVIDEQKCIGCGVCADICPLQVFSHKPKENKTPKV